MCGFCFVFLETQFRADFYRFARTLQAFNQYFKYFTHYRSHQFDWLATIMRFIKCSICQNVIKIYFHIFKNSKFYELLLAMPYGHHQTPIILLTFLLLLFKLNIYYKKENSFVCFSFYYNPYASIKWPTYRTEWHTVIKMKWLCDFVWKFFLIKWDTFRVIRQFK